MRISAEKNSLNWMGALMLKIRLTDGSTQKFRLTDGSMQMLLLTVGLMAMQMDVSTQTDASMQKLRLKVGLMRYYDYNYHWPYYG